MSHHSRNIYILGVGRAFAGVATALLYCVFESWMIAAHNERGFPGHLLGSTFNIAWGLNFPVAIVVGLLCEVTSKVPWGFVGDFDASTILLWIMVGTICIFWKENYGSETASTAENFMAGFRGFRDSWNVNMLSIIQTFFEGSMFVFVRFWWDILHEDEKGFSASAVFTLFMINCMVGVEILRVLKCCISKQIISLANCAVAGASLFLIAFDWNPLGPFYTKVILFCIYEICVGIYFNVMTDFRFELIDDSVRASVTAISRIPMNIVVVILLFTDPTWKNAFYFLAGFNVLAMVAAFFIRGQQQPLSASEEGTKHLAFV